MTEIVAAPRFSRRRVRLMVGGGLALVLLAAALNAPYEKAVPVDPKHDPKAFGALALTPPTRGALKRFGWVPRDVLARSVTPAKPATLPLAIRRRALGGSSIPEQEAFAGPVVPIDALPLTNDALGLSGPGAGGSPAALPGPMYASAGGAGGFASGGGGTGGAGGGGGGSGSGGTAADGGEVNAGNGAGGSAATPAADAGASNPEPVATPSPVAANPTTDGTSSPSADVGAGSAVPVAALDPLLLDPAYQPPSMDGPMLAPPPSDWPTSSPDPFETADPLPTATPAADPITAVPEPSTWAMLLLGFALVGSAIRRRAPGRTTFHA